MFDREQAVKAQKKYCEKKEYPHFAPNDGSCWKCGKNIYEEVVHEKFSTGISVERAGSELITGCPHCHWSYCE